MSKPLGMKQRPQESCNYVAESTYFFLREKVNSEQEALPGELVSGFRNSVNSLKSYMGIFYQENDSTEAPTLPPHPHPQKYSYFRRAHQPVSQPRKRRKGRRKEVRERGKEEKMEEEED